MNIIAVCTRNFVDQIGDLNVIVYNEEPFSVAHLLTRITIFLPPDTMIDLPERLEFS